MLETDQITIKAVWDDEAKVWVAESDDVPGLITEAESAQALHRKLEVLIPELFHENCRLLYPRTFGVSVHYYHNDQKTSDTFFQVAA